MKRQHISAIGIFVVVMILVMGSHACTGSRRNPSPPRERRPVTKKPTTTLTAISTSQPTGHQKSKNIKACWIIHLLYS